ncbi:MAG: SDR family oxidoreductase [Pseudomonadota bacterium]
MAKRSVIITNAATPIGEACVRRFSVAGDRLVLVDADEAAGRAAVQSLAEQNREAVFVAADPSDKLDVHNIVAEAIEGDATIDVLIHNHVTYSAKPFSELSADDLDAVYQSDVRGAFYMTQAVMKQMVRAADDAAAANAPDGAIVMIMADPRGGVGDVAFAAAQGALQSMVGALAAAGAAFGVRTNGVRLGPVRSDLYDDAQLKEFCEKSLVGAAGDPADVSELCYFLSSPAAGYITGSIIDLNGGGVVLSKAEKYSSETEA